MTPPRSVMLCALLALAGHAALLGLRETSPGAQQAGGGEAARLLHVKLVQARPEPVRPALQPATVPGNDPAPAAPPAPHAGDEAARGSVAPLFLTAPPEVGLPDEFLPDTGVQMRAYVRVGTDGQVLDIVAAVQPTDAPAAYQGLGERVLRDTRFEPAAQFHTHCLQLDFEPGSTAATWAWRADATPQRCLGNPARTARALPTPP